MHQLRTPNEGINQMWQTKYALAVPKKLEVKVISSPGVRSLWADVYSSFFTNDF